MPGSQYEMLLDQSGAIVEDCGKNGRLCKSIKSQ